MRDDTVASVGLFFAFVLLIRTRPESGDLSSVREFVKLLFVPQALNAINITVYYYYYYYYNLSNRCYFLLKTTA